MRTDKTKPPKIFKELFDVILTAGKDDSRKAARGVRKLLYSSGGSIRYEESYQRYLLAKEFGREK